MNKINKAIIKTAEAEAVKNALCSVFSYLDDRMQTVLLEKVLGVYEDPIINKESSVKENAKMLDYDPLTDKVLAEYTSSVTRFFETAEEAERFSINGGFGGEPVQNELYPYQGTYERKSQDWFFRDRWNRN